MKRLIAMGLALALGLSQSGCSFFAPSTYPMTITCPDQDAELFMNGIPIGKGTVHIAVPRDSTHTYMAKKGGKTGIAVVGTRLSGTGILDLIGGFFLWFPFLGLASGGSRCPEQDYVIIQIPP